MDIDAYERAAARTGRPTGTRDDLLLGAVGLAGEAGEIADLVKKHVFHGHDLDRDHALEELGDILWYVTWTASAFGSSLSEVAAGNLRKLERRYPEGFSREASRERRG